MSKPIIAIGFICSLIVMILIFKPFSVQGFTNLNGDLDNTLIHGEKNKFRFFVFGDIQHPAGNLARFNDILDAAKAKRPLFMILIGDFVETGTEEKYRFFIDKVKDSGVLNAGVPLFLALGNHDLGEKDRSDRLFRKYFGSPHYWFGYGSSLFVVVNTGDGAIDRSQLRWIESILKEKRNNYMHTFFFMHIPPTGFDFEQERTVGGVAKKEFMELMERYRVSVVFCGNYHSYRREVQNGVAYIVTGGGGSKHEDEESFYHYMDILVDGPIITEKLVALEDSHDYSDYVAYALAIYVYPWLLSNYPYLVLSFLVLIILVSVALFQLRKKKEPR